jgi:hypothetical protein
MAEMLKKYKLSDLFIGDVLLIKTKKSKFVDSVNEDYGLSQVINILINVMTSILMKQISHFIIIIKAITGKCEVISFDGDHVNFIQKNLTKISEIINVKLRF